MDELDDDTTLIQKDDKLKRPAKISSNDKAALLSSGEDDDEDEEDELEPKYTGEIVESVDCDEGVSVSGSDDEITGHTEEQETYIGDSNNNLDKVGLEEEVVSHLKIKKVKEGTLIAINDGDVIDEIVPDDNDDEGGMENKENEKEDENVTPTILPNNDNISEIANKLKEADLHPKNAALSRQNREYLEKNGFRESASSGGYNSTENYSSSNETKTRKKKFRKKNSSTEKEENIKNIALNHGNFNGNGELINTRDRTSSKSSSDFSHNISSLSNGEDSDRSARKNKNKRSMRNRTRHKLYLDDPDVHQLINEHVLALKRFIDNVHAGNLARDSEAYIEKDESSVIPNQPYQPHPNKARGRDLISRIRNEPVPDHSDDEDLFEQNGYSSATSNGKVHVEKKTKENGNVYEICPDCGDRHPPDEIIDESEICPDCGVQHNPYQHTPSANKPWKTYDGDSCRKSLLPGKKYQQVSTEQDPDDIVEDPLPSIEGPHTVDELTEGAHYLMKYLGSSQIISQHPINKETRMQQAQDAYNRMKGEDNEDEAATNVDMIICLERIKIINKETKFDDVMMDHALKTVCFICDMGNILVLMARRLTSDTTDLSLEKGKPISLGSILGEREKKMSKNICHVFETADAQKIAKAIGQAFNIAYRNFLQSNGISHEHVEQAEYCHVLESQKLVGADLEKLTDESNAKEVVLNKKAGEGVGLMLLESGWGSMLPTVFVAHIANYSVAARCQQLTVGDHVLSCNGASFVGMPLSECNTILKGMRQLNRVTLRVVSCPPVVDVVISRPDVKYQLGFSVQNGTICSLLRGGIAERGGVRVGHRIIEINGDSVVAKSHQYIVDLLANTIGSIGMKTMPIAMYRLMVGEDQPQHI